MAASGAVLGCLEGICSSVDTRASTHLMEMGKANGHVEKETWTELRHP
jgi:hypothetical protein